LIVNEFNLRHVESEKFDDGSNLASKKSLLGHIM
jgi:hypothetical protein